MKFSLPSAIVLLCATTALAFPQPNPNNDITDVEYDAADFSPLTTRATIHCSNDGKIKRVKPEYKGKCHPNDSKGFRGAHNCKDKESGKSFLCVQGGKATCYTIAAAEKQNLEGGECFK